MAKVSSIESESDEVQTVYTIKVSRDHMGQEPDVADLPADIGAALQAWLLTHYKPRVMAGAPAWTATSGAPVDEPNRIGCAEEATGHGRCIRTEGHVGRGFRGHMTDDGYIWITSQSEPAESTDWEPDWEKRCQSQSPQGRWVCTLSLNHAPRGKGHQAISGKSGQVWASWV